MLQLHFRKTATREKKKAQSEKSASDLRRSLSFSIASLDLICERLRQDMIHSMRVVGCACKSFESKKMIRNFPVPILSSEELRTRDLVRYSRRVALRCQNKKKITEVSNNVSYIVNAGQRLPGSEGTLRGFVEVESEDQKKQRRKVTTQETKPTTRIHCVIILKTRPFSKVLSGF